MIYKKCVMTIDKNKAALDEDIYLYRLDKNIELYFTIVNNKYRFNKGDMNNIILITNASFFQVRLYKNAEIKYTFAIQPTDGGQAILTITDDLIDDPIEVGDYDFQISLLDEEKTSMISMPIVSKQLHVCEPLVSDDATMGKAVLGLSKLATGEIKNAFDSDGNYVREIHKDGDILSASIINKFEEALDTNTKAIKSGTGTPYDDTKIKTDINTIKTDLGTEELTTTAKDVKGAVNEVNSQYKDIAHEVNAIKSSSLINQNGGKTLKIWAGTKVEYDALLVKDENTVYLVEGSGGGSTTVTTYTITNNLSNCTNSNSVTSADENSSYTSTITADINYTLSTVTITMGGTDITNTAYTNGTIFIDSVTGDIVITARAIANESSSEETSYTYFNGYVDDSGNLVENAGSYITNEYIEIPANCIYNLCMVIYVNVNKTSDEYNALSAIRGALYDADKNFISKIWTKQTTPHITPIASNAKYVRLGATIVDGTSEDIILSLLSNISFIKKNAINLNYEVGKTCDSAGIISIDSKKTLSDYIEIDDGSTTLYTSSIAYNTFRCFDSNKNCLGNPTDPSLNRSISRTIPTGTKYIRLVLGANDTANIDMTDYMVNEVFIEVGIDADNTTSYILRNS